MSVVTTRGILLRAHPYSESSRVLRFLTADLGVVGVMARGARKRGGKGAAGVDLFAESELILFLKGNRDLQTLREATPCRTRRGLGRHPLRLTAAGVLAEVVLRHHGEGPGEELYESLSLALDRLEEAAPESVVAVLLVEAWSLVASFGFLPLLDSCVECGEPIRDDEMGRFDFAAGGMRCASCGGETAGPRVGPGALVQLSHLLNGEIPTALNRPRSHLRLLSDFITYHVSGGRPLEAFSVLAELLPPDNESS